MPDLFLISSVSDVVRGNGSGMIRGGALRWVGCSGLRVGDSIGVVMLDGVYWLVDPGHGWLRVPIVSAEGLTFSDYSYIDQAAGVLYLEEDCDAGVWLRVHGVSGSAFPVRHVSGAVSVRHLPRVAASGRRLWVAS